MKIYYSDARSAKTVSSKNAVEAGRSEALQILGRMIAAPSYLGIMLDYDTVFQALLNPDGSVWIEKLTLANQQVLGTVVPMKVALEAVDAIYDGKDFMEALGHHYFKWLPSRV